MENMWKWEQGTLVSELIQGMQLAKQLRLHLGASSSSVESRDLLLQKILSSYEKALLILKLSRPTEQPQQNVGGITCVPESPLTINGSPRSDDLEKDNQDIRDVSKKRKIMPRWTDQVRVSSENLLEGPHDDGYSWRKYGQKDILGAKYPRSYYRCTYRNTQNCWATKQVQRSDEDPTLFEVTYRGTHTCANGNHAVPSPEKQHKSNTNGLNNTNYQPLQSQDVLSEFRAGLRVNIEGLDNKEMAHEGFDFSLRLIKTFFFTSSPLSLSKMDCHVEPTSATADSIPPSPPHDPLDSVPIGSPEDEILYPPSDDDIDHDHGHENEDDHGQEDQVQNHEISSAVDVLTDNLKKKIIKQAEYYFSDENLPTDKYMMGLIKKNKEGFVPMSVISSFRKMKRLTRNYPSIVAALKESSLLVVSSDGKKVKRRNPLPFIEVRDPKLFTVLVENLPEDHLVENIKRIFGEVGSIKKISVRDPHAVEETKKTGRADILISSKLHALVEYETIEAAEKAVATLNDEHDWRNGMHVKLLERKGKHGQRKQAWRGPAHEKNINAQVSDQTGTEEKNPSSEYHEDIPDDEDGEHLSKEKNGFQPRNRRRGRRQKNRGTNGHGHGTTSSCHAVEPSKPPPGPRMPDGTRGFTMGRGRPLVSKPS